MSRQTLATVGIAAIVLTALEPIQAPAALSIADTPLFLVGSVQPLVMLDISKDQQLYKKAYNDYSDLDNDGQLETTYKHSIDYYGYFDPKKCYVYSSSNKRFEPDHVTATKYCTAGGQWSGNFLNWASMSRMDAVRKLLYGGMRSQNRTNGDGNGIIDGDTATSTVLERVYLPNDAHAWAKYYDGSDIGQLTPYTPPNTSTSSTTSRTITNTGANTVDYVFNVAAVAGFSANDFVRVSASSDPSVYLKGQITAVASPNITVRVANSNYSGSGTFNLWTLENLSKRGITLCNTTLHGASPQNKSQTNTNLPQLRVAKGNFSLWSANERWQCLWRNEKDATNSNNFALSGVPAASNNPYLNPDGTGTGLGEYFVRIQACVPRLIGTERCKQYDTANPDNFKPIGLLQVYGDADQIRFGLMTGSYRNNISGGVLRKNAAQFTDEVDLTDGTFTNTVGIVRTLDRMRIYGYCFSGCNDDGSYVGASGDNCGFRLTSIPEGNCSSWGNPMAEVYYESLRYFTTTTPTSAYAYTDTGSQDEALGLRQPSWTAAVTQTNYCAPLNTLVFNASVSTNDFDLAAVTMADINSNNTAAALADLVGTGEAIPGNSYFVGVTGSNNNELCDAKAVGNLGSVYGICPEGPGLQGSYLMPGMAYHAHINQIRDDLTVPPDDYESLKVATYGVQLATNVPRIPIALRDETKPRAILQPAFRLDISGSTSNPKGYGGGALVDMKVLSADSTTSTASGVIYVNWENSEQGSDYDQDAWGLVRYCLTTVNNGCGAGSTANTLTITTDLIAESAGGASGFGYVISGTTKDGAHFHSGFDSFNFTDSTGALGCTNCVVGDGPTSATYTLRSAAIADSLEDPLYYAAKWGGFNDIDKNGAPNSVAEWDVLKTDGTPGTDGIPDNYFFVSNPLGLETALNAAFRKILTDSSASAVATNSSALNTGTRIYQGRFNTYFWNGQLLSYRLDQTTGSVLSAASPPPGWDPADRPYPEWDANQKLETQVSASTDTRLILTRDATGQGSDFVFSNLSVSQQAALDMDAQSNVDVCGLERVGYLRGHSADEGAGTFTCSTTPSNTIEKFRVRDSGVLGDIINSNPVYVGAPSAGYADADHPGYVTFANNFANRMPVVYVGANDGMLHGFDGSVNSATNTPTTNAGKEVLAYVPSTVYANLSRLTDNGYSSAHKYFVDGSPMMADACVGSCTATATAVWKTVLVGGLGAGGKGFYALNVTNPDSAAKDSGNTPEFKVSRASDLVLWEFTNADDADLGLTYNIAPTNLYNGQAKQIVKFQNGRWGAVVGNGYNSASGKAVLYVLFLQGPTGSGNAWQAGGVDYVKIEADAPVTMDNGLSTPVPMDSDGDGLADLAYAGDIKGNVWRFDLSDASPSNWGKSLLLAAGSSQPITTPPVVTLHPANGQMVFVGTGKYLESTDNSTTIPVQSIYGIHDTGATVVKSSLSPMTVTTTTVGSTTYRTTAAGCGSSPLPACPAVSNGWYVNLPTAGERATGAPKLVQGIVFFNTLIPSTAPCDFGGTGWFMGFDYLTGGPPDYRLFDTDGSGSIDNNDTIVVGVEVGAALGGTTIIAGNASGGTGVGVSSLTSGKVVTTLLNLSGTSPRRLNWREIVQ